MRKKLIVMALVFCMVLSLLPATAFAVEGGTVSTAEELDAAIANGGDITLGADIELAEIITINKDVTLDLKGYKISGSKINILTVDGGKLTIQDSSEDGKGEIFTVRQAIYVKNKGEVTLNGGTISVNNEKSNNTYAVFLTSGASFIANGGKISAVSKITAAYGIFTQADDVSISVANAEIYAVTTERGQANGIYQKNPGEAIKVEDSKIIAYSKNTSAYGVYLKGTGSVVENCTVHAYSDSTTKTAEALAVWGDSTNPAAVTVKSGSYSAYGPNENIIRAVVATGGKYSASPTVSQGYTAQELSSAESYSYTIPGQTSSISGSYTHTIVADTTKYIKNGTAEYSTIAAAVEAAQPGDTLKLIANIDLYSSGAAINKGITLDLNGYTINSTKNSGIISLSGGTETNPVVLTDSAENKGVINAKISVGAGYTTIGAVTINNAGPGITAKGVSGSNANLTVDGAAINVTASGKDNGRGLQLNDYYDVTVKNCNMKVTFTGTSTTSSVAKICVAYVDSKDSTLNIMGGQYKLENNGTGPSTSHIIVPSRVGARDIGSAIISGGTFNVFNTTSQDGKEDSTRNYLSSSYNSETIMASGGTYNFEPTNCLTEGYAPKNNKNGTWTVEAGIFVKDADNKEFTSLQAAVYAVASGTAKSPLTLQEYNISLSEPLTLAANVVIVTGGKTITLGGSPAVILKDGVTMPDVFKDSFEAKIEGDGETKYYKTLDEAISKAMVNEVVMLNQDCEIASTIRVDKNLKLDLNGHTLTAGDSTADSDGVKWAIRLTKQYFGSSTSVTLQNSQDTVGVINGGIDVNAQDSTKVTLTIKKGVEVKGRLPVFLQGYNNSGKAVLNLYGKLTAEADYAAIQGNGQEKYYGTEINIYNTAEISAQGVGIYHPQDGVVKVYGGKITGGNTGIEMRAGKLTVVGGEITGGSGTPSSSSKPSGSTTSNAAIAIAQHTTKLPVEVTIKGGTFAGGAALYESNPESNDSESLKKVKISITDGQFAGEIHSDDCAGFIFGGVFAQRPSSAYIAEGMSAVDNTDQTTMEDYPFTIGNPEAEVVLGETAVEVDENATYPENSEQQGVDQNSVKAAAEKITATAGLSKAAKANEKVEQAATSGENQTKAEKKLEEETGIDKPNPGADLTPVQQEENKVVVVVQPYLKITPKGSEIATDGSTTIKKVTFDITPRYNLVATYQKFADAALTDPANKLVTGENETDRNAVIIAKDQPMTVTTPVTIRLPIPNKFANENQEVYILHKSTSGDKEYTLEVKKDTDDSLYVEFENKYGFSDFILSTKSTAVAKIGDVGYTKLQDAVDAVNANETIDLLADAGEATVSRTISFKVIPGNYDYTLKNGTNTSHTQSEKDNSGAIEYSFTYTPPTGGGSGGGGSVATYPVTVAESQNGKVTSSPADAAKDAKVTLTVTPDKGYELDSLTVTDQDGKAVAVSKTADGTYTFTMPASKATVSATFKAVEATHDCPSEKFTDVDITQYYHEAVDWAVTNGVTIGTSATTFSPNATCTRAQMVTFLWRAVGCPEPAAANNPFTDVQAGAYYYDAVLWAVEKGVTVGTSATTFSPSATVTRGQAATFLYRCAGSPAVSGSNPFTDVSSTAYYADAVQWAVNSAITNGTGATTFSPENDCTRAQIVTFLYRYMGD